MRKFLAGLLLFFGFCAAAQNTYNNEWIDYTKTYHRFRINKDGLYRISGAALSAAGLGAATAQDFQLWRNGVQIPLYTSVASGTLAPTDFIEFFGKMNDGKADRELFREPGFHLNDKWSLISDSATYFLTVNPGAGNLRLQTVTNNVAGNTLPAEPYFIHQTGLYFKNKINPGLFYVVGTEHLFSSSYDKGEGWTSPDIDRNATLTNNITNLFPATTGPNPTIRTVVSGNAYNSRRYKVAINGDSVVGSPVPYLNESIDTASFSLSLLSSGSASIAITNLTDDCGTTTCPSDKMVVHRLDIAYPRQFNFGNAVNFEFSLPASAAGNYLEITGFADGGVAPVLYDMTNGKRYVTELSGSLIKVVLQPSATPRELVLVSYNGLQVTPILSLQQRNFVNYNLVQNQGNYLIISNPFLFNGVNGANPVEEYRAYRESPQGGSYSAKIYIEEQLIDQFGFGIRKHPAGIRNFIRFAKNKFAAVPKYVYIIGRGIHYLHQKNVENVGTETQRANAEKLNLVPTYGWPASDILLAAEPGSSSPSIPIGRLTAINAAEVSIYLKKVKEYELAQQTLSPSIGDKAWMKNIAHIAGAGEQNLAESLTSYLNSYTRIIEDTLYGAKVTTFTKTSTNLVQQLSDQDLTNLFNQGLSLITYYGHSSPTTLEFNLDDPANYNNQGKYPMFLALGCNAGNTFDFNEGRFTQRNYLSDKYVLAPDRGAINFIASTHFGIVHYLDIWNIRAYPNMATHQYRGSIGEIMKKTIEDVNVSYRDDFFARCNAEETILNGDPAITLNQQAKPDYVITDTMVKVSPNFVSVADLTFRVDISLMNLGKATNRPIVVETKRRYPDGTEAVVHRDTLRGTRYRDVISFNLPIDATKDKGTNTIFVTVDADGAVDELFETNNSTYRELFIFEDEIRPVYPYNYSIVSSPNISLRASTANPFSPSKQYQMEIDTTENFNSPLKATQTVNSVGGLIEFQPGLSFQNNAVYYWRVAPVPASGTPLWKNSSFVYIANSSFGFNQSHYYQHLKSNGNNIGLRQNRKWEYDSLTNNLTIRSGVFGAAATQEAELSVTVNGSNFIRSACAGNTIVFNIFDPNTFRVRANPNQAYGSNPVCSFTRQWNFEFDYRTPANRKKIMDFMDSIPAGWFVVVRNILINNQWSNYTANEWKSDEAIYGAGNSLYHKLKNVGFNTIDSLNAPRVFSFVYQKNVPAYTPSSKFTNSNQDLLIHSVNMKTPDSLGTITSPAMGPAKAWKLLEWDGATVDATPGDNPKISIVGIRANGSVDTLRRGIVLADKSIDISSINAATYPHLRLIMRNADSIHYSPYQLGYWRLTADAVPEGAVMPNIQFSMKDTFDVGEPVKFKLAFKNISDGVFTDSMRVKVIVYDRNNTARTIQVPKMKKPLNGGEVLDVQFDLKTEQLVGANTLFVHVNPDDDQLEQYQFNNFIFRNFYVRGDTLNPLLDVTFDNVHILHRDIVASKPSILIKLKDEAKWMPLSDTSLVSVQVRYPDPVRGTVSSNSITRTFNFNSDTLRFIPASGSPNGDNTASIEFKPFFEQDGEYELVVTGKDMSSNNAGSMSYRVAFQVINKAMISNMLNYPNPFTTSTAFVFTLTGAVIPQNLKIQILTVTGKIVREITKEELGPLHIGRNITEFKWDGTDQFGQKLANGVYLYRVVTNLNGKSLEKYTSPDESTDKYFNKGYGKMYLMR